MSKQYQPLGPFTVSCELQKRSVKKMNGANKETFTAKGMFFCSAKSYGGTEKIVNDVYVIEDTWIIDTWYNPNIAKGDHIRFLDDGSEFEILASPENINRRGQYMRFKVRRIGG
jgi:SPP1 family predicted phage head-tail adaptor